MLKQIIKLYIVTAVMLSGGCEKPEPFTFDESVHLGRVITSVEDTFDFKATFSTIPNEQSGLFSINARLYPTGVFNKPPLVIRIRVADLSIGCKALRYAPFRPIGGAIEYEHAVATIMDGHQRLGDYMLREDRESQACIDLILQDGQEMLGTFELHMYRERASFPWLETEWPDTLSIVSEGQFRAFGFR